MIKRICQVSTAENPDLYLAKNRDLMYFVAVDLSGNHTTYKVTIDGMIRLRDFLNDAIREVKS